MTRICICTAAMLVWFLSAPLAGHAASFDCTKASSHVERLICAENELSRLDDDLAVVYRAASAAPDAAEQVRRDQRQWLAARNACSDSACIKSAYVRRLAALPAPAGATTTTPAPILREILSAQFQGADNLKWIDADRIAFSQYDKSGNTKNLVAVNIADGSVRNLVEGVQGGDFVAEDARYLAYRTEGVNANPLIVFDKRAGKRVASTRLQSPIVWGHISGDRLLIAQRLDAHKAAILVYSLPGLKLERNVEIAGGPHFALWGEKIVSLGYKLRIHDLDFKEIAVMDMPEGVPNLGARCDPGPLRISGDKAVIGTNCLRLAIVDLPSARVEHILPTASNFQSFAISEGLIFTTDALGEIPDVRVIELSSGRELSRLKIDASFLAMQGKSLLAMKKREWRDPLVSTLYEMNFSAIRSKTSRVARTLSGCRAAERVQEIDRDLHAALSACEAAGILGFVEATDLSADLHEAVEKYARWLTLSLSRYSEGEAILERLQRLKPDPKVAAQLALTRRKAGYLDLPLKDAKPSQTPDRKGVTRASVNFGAFSNLLQFDGDRLYIARWDCDRTGDPGVTLDVVDRKTFQAIKRVVITSCDDSQQDAIASIRFVSGYIVLGLEYRFQEDNRPTVAIVNTRALTVTKKAFVQQPISSLSQWNGRLLACASTSNPSHNRFDPVSARYVDATEEEARACVNGDPVPPPHGPEREGAALGETSNYRIYAIRGLSDASFRITHKGSSVSTVTPKRKMLNLEFADPNRDALLLRSVSGKYIRFTYYDIEAKKETVLFELDPRRRNFISTVWGRFLLVSAGRDMLVYDLERRMVVDYEKDLIREGFLNNCCGVDRNGIRQFLLDGDRLIALTFDGENSRVINLPAYTTGLPARDFFLALEGR